MRHGSQGSNQTPSRIADPWQSAAIRRMIRDDPRQLSSPIRSSPPIRGERGLRTPERTEHFTAMTCPKCSSAILSGTTYGLRLDLEPRTLDDHTEYLALADNVRTYNLHPDLTARRRHLEHITRPERHPRHAEHVCGQQYGRNPRPAPSVPAVVHDDPPF